MSGSGHTVVVNSIDYIDHPIPVPIDSRIIKSKSVKLADEVYLGATVRAVEEEVSPNCYYADIELYFSSATNDEKICVEIAKGELDRVLTMQDFNPNIALRLTDIAFDPYGRTSEEVLQYALSRNFADSITNVFLEATGVSILCCTVKVGEELLTCDLYLTNYLEYIEILD